MHINWQMREIGLKIVYYGPALSGKTTNIEQIHARIHPDRRSELVSLKTYADRTLFFDFFQFELGKICNLTPKIQLYTVPGQAYYEASRKLVLRGADGVVFVADSAANRIKANLDAWKKLHAYLLSAEISLASLPIIIQFNKRDLPTALAPIDLQTILQVSDFPIFPAVASRGEGVLDTLKMAIQTVMAQVQREIN